MTTLQLAARTVQPTHEPTGHPDDLAPAPTARRDLDGWTCGVGESSNRHAGERCDDIVPELIIELI